jgi:hypothetical protein
MKLPEYFKTHSREDLYDLKKSPFAYGHGLEGMTYYEAISHTPERLHMFNTTMVQMEQSVPILGLFPFASMKEEVEAEKDRPFVVDIGGGQGQALIALQKEAPAGFGAKLILQDRAVVLDKLPDERIPNIEKMVYDFHTPQPVKSKQSILPLNSTSAYRRTKIPPRRARLLYPSHPPRLLRPGLYRTPQKHRIGHGAEI